MNRHLTLADLVDELCDPRPHVERIPYWDNNRNRKHRIHKTTMPGLLAQMMELFQPGGNPDAGPGVPGSRPPGNWAAVADHTLITAQVARWCWDLRIDLRDTTEGNLRALVGASGGLDSDTRTRLTRDAARWHRIAETVTGWRVPPQDVRAPCPALTGDTECKARTLRVNYTDHEAYCSTCGTVWDRDTIGLLAETVLAYNRTAAAEADLARARARQAKETAA